MFITVKDLYALTPTSPWDGNDFSEYFRESVLNAGLPLVFVSTSVSIMIISEKWRNFRNRGYTRLPIEDQDETDDDMPRERTLHPSIRDRLVVAFILSSLQTVLYSLSAIVRWTSFNQDDENPYTYRIWSQAILGLCWLYALSLVIFALIRKQNGASTHLLIFYILTFLLALINLRSAIIETLAHGKDSVLPLTLAIANTVIPILLLIVNITTPRHIELIGKTAPDGRQLSKEVTASTLSWMTFEWITPMIKVGYNTTLKDENLWELVKELQAKSLYTIYSALRIENFLWRIIKANLAYITMDMSLALCSSVVSYGSPYFMKLLLEYLENIHSSTVAAEIAYFYVIAMFVSRLIQSELDATHLWYGRAVSVKLKAILTTQIYEKALRKKDTSGATTKGEEDKKSSTGKIVNLMSADVTRVAELFGYLYMLFTSPLELIIATYFLYNLLGISAFVGMLAMVIALPANQMLMRANVRVNENLLKVRDERLALMNELLQAIRMIKYFAWESDFTEKIQKLRSIEIGWVKRGFINSIAFTLLWFGVPIMVTLLTFVSFTKFEGKVLTASIAFTSLTVFNMLRHPLTIIPGMIMQLVQSWVSIKRIENFLDEDELPDLSCRPKLPSNSTVAEPILGFVNASFVWHLTEKDKNTNSTLTSNNDNANVTTSLVKSQDNKGYGSTSTTESPTSSPTKSEFQLRDLNINFPVGKMTLVCGPTGSGKTSLLIALLGEMDQVEGATFLPRRHIALDPETGLYEGVAYVAQTPWLQQMSIRENIVFGSQFEEDRYKKVLEMTALIKDLEILADGDKTEIGEKGITLSGGQKARVALARALYSRAKHVLLDDPLSAVDTHTGKHLFENCLMGELMMGRTRILVTHHEQLCLPGAAYFVRLNNGRVAIQGTVEDLINDNQLKPTVIIENIVENDLNGNSDSHDSLSHPLAQTDDFLTKSKEANKLVEEEKSAEGSVKSSIYKTYLKASGGWLYWTWIVFLYVLTRFTMVLEPWWIRAWGAAYEKAHNTTLLFTHHILENVNAGHSINLLMSDNTIVTNWFTSSDDGHRENEPSLNVSDVDVNYYITIYVLISASTLFVFFLRGIFQCTGSIRASKILHTRILASVMGSPIRFFDTTPVGRILNRFSKDFETVDSKLTVSIMMVLFSILGIVSAFVVIAFITPLFMIPALLILAVYLYIGKLYVKSSRELQRLDSTSRSPIFTHFGETLIGVATIRAFGAQTRFTKEILKRIDTNNRAFYFYWMSNRWLLLRFDFVGAFVAFFAGILVVLNDDKIDAGMAGISLSYALNFVTQAYWLVRLYTSLENDLNSMERVQEYIELPQEAPGVIEDRRPPADWPSNRAGIEVKDLVIRYAEGLDPVLNKVSFSVKPAEKVGIVGRTGSGKSTLALSLLRIVEPSSGTILVDNIDITQIGLKDLRSRLCIIPQDSVLFSGTIRTNLDPFNQYNDDDLWWALKKVHLVRNESESTSSSHDSEAAANNSSPVKTLDDPVSEGGNNFSHGQKQLLCLARALLRRSKIIMMDEATASVDFDTDRAIQTTIRTKLGDATILTIAHRLNSVIDYDKIMVLDEGKLIEFDTPFNLINLQNSQFRKMCLNSGEFDSLYETAKSKQEQIDASK